MREKDNNINDEERKEILQKIEEGKSCEEICEEYRISESTYYRYKRKIRNHDTKKRKRKSGRKSILDSKKKSC